MSTVAEIESAIGHLTPQEVEELAGSHQQRRERERSDDGALSFRLMEK